MWRDHIPKSNITFPSQVLGSSDKRPFGTWRFTRFQLDRVLLIVKEHVSKLLLCVTWKLRPEEGCRVGQLLVFAYSTVLALEETFLSMCRRSRAMRCRFNTKTQWQMFLLLYCRHDCVLQKDTNMASPQFGWHTSANKARMKNDRDLILGEVVYISVMYRIPDSWLYSLNGYDF